MSGANLAALRAAARGAPEDPSAWRALADACFYAGLAGEADAAYNHASQVAVHDPVLRKAGLALAQNRLDVAERLIKPYLQQHPTDVAAIRMLAELAARLGRIVDAESLLTRALELAPGFLPARHNMVMVHLRRNRYAEALAEVDTLIAAEPDNPAFLNLQGVALAKIGDFDDAAARFEAVLKGRPGQPAIWMSYGHALKTLGRRDDAVAAYRQAIAQKPGLGEAWWSLANLKSVHFDADDMDAMEAALADGAISDDDRLHLHFALGKAQEDAARPEPAFRHYAAGNALRAEQLGYDPAGVEALVEAAVARLDAGFFASAPAPGADGAPQDDATPIFVLGMPRSGSTLVEQILASHSAVEGTRELPDVELAARRMGPLDARHIDALMAAGPEQLAAMGAAYLESTRLHRKLGRAMFIDKMPNNWAYVPLIRLMLPQAKIIDTRRAAMACCFSNFKQHFARGQAFTYRLDHMARYFAAYVRFMDHMDKIMPGQIIHVRHEDMVEDTEAQVRNLLAALGLGFEPACLRFWETARSVQTASSEQVRRPIFREGLDGWQSFDPWLGELRGALGDLAGA